MNNREPIYRPISDMPMVAEVIDGQLEDVIFQLENFKEAKPKPHVMDDDIVERATRIYSEQKEYFSFYKELFKRWKKEARTKEQKKEVKRLTEQLDKLKKSNKDILEILDYLKDKTINKILEMDDAELGIKSLLGKLRD